MVLFIPKKAIYAGALAAALILLAAAAPRPSPQVPAAAPAAPSRPQTMLVLDAGHGGEDGGATGVSGTSEAALNLDISLRLRDLLRLCGVRVSMIRETDTAVYSDGCRTISEKKVSDIKNRTETVNQTENALLLSVHQNFFTEGKYHGAQVFYAKTPGSQALAEQLQANLALGLEPGNRRQCWSNADFYPITRKNSGSCSRSIRKSWPP